ncbi:hypothetical protein AGLY_016638 [Aphis glycines]|uniref:Uncharacterized protein n=1 Tax=Aphis glycines TaxID=307491 RepID=A0A6G0SZC5_APHGL|nr:hypothetical protein AGLY_016638 [Aphis glycines]
MIYSNKNKTEMLDCYVEMAKNTRAAARLYKTRYPDRPSPEHTRFYILYKNLQEYGSFTKPKSRVSKAINVDNSFSVLASLIENPHTSLRTIADEDSKFLTNILWTDEAKFHNNGQVNHHNTHYWNDSNPHWINETNKQVRWGVNVLCGIIDNHLIGPYFFDENLNDNKYLDFLKNDIPILLENISLKQRLNLIWLQDGAPAHNTLAVRAYLNEVYGDHNWFGTYSPTIQWPPRSPDLSVLDFFFWGHLKNEVYKEKSNSVEELKQKIKDCCSKIKSSVLKKSTSIEVLKRLHFCLAEYGKQFEHKLKYK